VHYFEDGNLQLQSAKQVPATNLTFSSDAELAANVTKFIQVRKSYTCVHMSVLVPRLSFNDPFCI